MLEAADTSLKPEWLTIWTAPRQTIRRIIDRDPSYGKLPLAAIWGISTALGMVPLIGLAFDLSPATMAAGAVLIGPFLGLGLIYLGSGIYTLVGRVFGSKAPVTHMRAALAWSVVPTAVSLLQWIVWLVLFGEDAFVFGTLGVSHPFPTSAIVSGVSLLTYGLVIWGIAIFVATYAEVHQFTVARAIGSLLAGGLVIGILSGMVFGICLPLAVVVLWFLVMLITSAA